MSPHKEDKPAEEAEKNTEKPDESTTDGINADASILFYKYDREKASAKGSFYFKVPEKTIDTGNLKDMREQLANAPQQKKYVGWSFCSSTGALIPDFFSVKEYLDKIASDSDEKTSSKELSFYLLKPTPIAYRGANKESPKVDLSKVDTKLPDGVKLMASPELHKGTSSFDRELYTAQAADSISKAANLSEREWAIITQNNDALYGFTIDRSRITENSNQITLTGVSVARSPAFKYKSRKIPSYFIDEAAPNNTMIDLRIPKFQVDDQSYVSVYETKNTFQSSLASSSFSEVDVKAAVSGGAFGWNVGLSAGYGSEETNQTSSSSLNESEKMNISYNFPRVTIRLDEDCIELTDECASDLQNVKNLNELERFLTKYGQFFCTRLQLGGRLFASEEKNSDAKGAASSQASAMKVSAALSFSSPYHALEIAASYGKKSQNDNSNKESSFQSNLCWEATGGDTLLCNNPPLWCRSVAPYYNWRVTKRDAVMQVIDFIGNINGDSRVSEHLKNLKRMRAEERLAHAPAILTDKVYFQWIGKGNQKGLLTCYHQKLKQADLYSFPPRKSVYGAFGIQESVSDSDLRGQMFKVENLDGTSVELVHYEKRYALKCSSLNRYLTWVQYPQPIYTASGQIPAYYAPVAREEKCGIIFRNPKADKDESAIQTGAKVKIAICKNTIDNSDEMGILSLKDGDPAKTCTIRDVELEFTLRR